LSWLAVFRDQVFVICTIPFRFIERPPLSPPFFYLDIGVSPALVRDVQLTASSFWKRALGPFRDTCLFYSLDPRHPSMAFTYCGTSPRIPSPQTAFYSFHPHIKSIYFPDLHTEHSSLFALSTLHVSSFSLYSGSTSLFLPFPPVFFLRVRILLATLAPFHPGPDFFYMTSLSPPCFFLSRTSDLVRLAPVAKRPPLCPYLHLTFFSLPLESD